MGRPCYQRVMYTLGSVIMGTTVMDVKRGVPLDAKHMDLEPDPWPAEEKLDISSWESFSPFPPRDIFVLGLRFPSD